MNRLYWCILILAVLSLAGGSEPEKRKAKRSAWWVTAGFNDTSEEPDWWGPTSHPSYLNTPAPRRYEWFRPTREPYRYRPVTQYFRWRPTRQPPRWRPTPRSSYWNTPAPRRYWWLRPTREPSRYRPGTPSYWNRPSLPQPRIHVYRQVSGEERVLVICAYQMRTRGSSFQMKVEGGRSITHRDPNCLLGAVCLFNITIPLSASLTCEHIVTTGDAKVTLTSDTYVYSDKGWNQMGTLDERAIVLSSAYQGFSIVMAIGLIVMMIVVTVISLKSWRKDTLDPPLKDHGEAERMQQSTP